MHFIAYYNVITQQLNTFNVNAEQIAQVVIIVHWKQLDQMYYVLPIMKYFGHG